MIFVVTFHDRTSQPTSWLLETGYEEVLRSTELGEHQIQYNPRMPQWQVVDDDLMSIPKHDLGTNANDDGSPTTSYPKILCRPDPCPNL